jgi:hypothetical protein
MSVPSIGCAEGEGKNSLQPTLNVIARHTSNFQGCGACRGRGMTSLSDVEQTFESYGTLLLFSSHKMNFGPSSMYTLLRLNL